MPNDPQAPSHRRPSPSQGSYEMSCPNCGTKLLAKSGASCPKCSGSMRQGDEMTKKVIDDNDLIK